MDEGTRYAPLGCVKRWEHRYRPGSAAFVEVARGPEQLFLPEHEGGAGPDTPVHVWVRDPDAVAAGFGVPVVGTAWGTHKAGAARPGRQPAAGGVGRGGRPGGRPGVSREREPGREREGRNSGPLPRVVWVITGWWAEPGSEYWPMKSPVISDGGDMADGTVLFAVRQDLPGAEAGAGGGGGPPPR
ncbi:glyoxalase superfamily protein, partial [Streptomyces sp. URMC 129]|uniref:glyoxalase superfamily protein n=1 Tax=Streptomyces sp. URMC 129 TaxID=3423407 RepID=UPI003F1A444C